MSSSQIVGIALVIAGLGDCLALFWLRQRMPPDRMRVMTMALLSSAAGMVGLGIVFLMR